MKPEITQNYLTADPIGNKWWHKPNAIWFYCLLLSIIFLLIGTKSSPLYPFNDWVDANAFFTMGKGMMNGKVIYRDLFEQKGPLLYFIYGLASLVSPNTFIGVFFVEVFSYSIFLFFCYKSLLLFIDCKYALIALPIISASIPNLTSFALGGSAEELCLPLLAISLYYLLKVIKTDQTNSLPPRIYFWNGIIAGAILWIKFSMLGFWIGWIISIFIFQVRGKNWIQFIKGELLFLLGLMITTIPWVLYFGLNHSISDWINTYFTINLSSYSGGTFLLSRLNVPLSNVAFHIYVDPIFGGIFWLGIIVFIVFDKFIQSRISRILIFLCILLLVWGIYGGELGYIYYYLILTPFFIFGIIVLQDLVRDRIDKLLSAKVTVFMILMIVVSSVLVTLKINPNTQMLFMAKEELVQYKFAEIINKSKNPTLLNYGSLDMGFYTTTGIIPTIRFFENQNIIASRFPLNMDEQNRYIQDKLVQFVVMQRFIGEYPVKKITPWLYKNYELIASERQFNEDRIYDYYLFERVE